MMKLKFVDQEYQTDAVNSIVDIFDGAENKDSVFTIDISQDKNYSDWDIEGEGFSYNLGYGNKLSLDDFELLENVRKIQEENNILKSTDIQGRNFSVEMETGTGKTYVYTKTILELNKRYGFTKFIVVVPSVAIKEGVYKSFQITEEHFKFKYDNVPYSYFVYDSSKLNRIQTFSTSTNIEIMIINIDSFKKDMKNMDDEKKANIIHRESDRLSGNKPIDLIAETNPIVIIDEPQSVDNTKKAKAALKTLNPLVTLRYSATHKQLYNLMYQLTPVDAYQKKLVKQIEVSSVLAELANAKPYIKLHSVDDKNGYKAKVEIWVKQKNGTLKKKKVTVKPGDDLEDASKGVDYYKDQNFIVSNIDCFEDEENIAFAEGTVLHVGEATGEVNQEAIKRAQISETIRLHLEKEAHYVNKGIKVLSLIFIDKVANYRQYDSNSNEVKGKYAIWFEEEYKKLIESTYKHLLTQNSKHFSVMPDQIHDGYFSIDNKKRFKDSFSGTSKDDESTYELIMKDKEKLLDLKEPLRFVFSHSALKEGWDNPNVFQVCTLVETKDTLTKRQKIGRGLRICVNQDGSRVLDPKYNKLSVVANEAYKTFAKELQTELEREAGFKFGVVEKVSFTNLDITREDGTERKLNQKDSQQIYKFLKKEGYLNTKNKVTKDFFRDVKNGSFDLPPEYVELRDKIILKVEELSKEYEIKNADDKIKVKLNKKVYLSENFTELFNKIKQKTFYSVNIDLEAFTKECSRKIAYDMPQIEAEKVRRERSDIDVTNTGVISEDRARYMNLGSVNDFEELKRPDLLRRLQQSTGLLRKTIAEILINTNRLKEFNYNPELFMKHVSTIIRRVKREFMMEGIMYYKLDEFYKMKEVFDDTELYGYKNKNILDISDEKNIYDHVIFDSEAEELFAQDAERDDEVIVYAKLPTKFFIETPYGKYSPDWVVMMKSPSGDKLYFVAETKGSMDRDQLRRTEEAKILSGRKHFKVVDSEIKYKLVNKFNELKK